MFTHAFPTPMRIAPTALEQSGTAADYGYYNNGGAVNCTSVPTFYTSMTVNVGTTLFTATGGYVLNGVAQAVLNTNGYLGFSAEL